MMSFERAACRCLPRQPKSVTFSGWPGAKSPVPPTWPVSGGPPAKGAPQTRSQVSSWGISRQLTKHAACLGLIDEALHVFFDEESVLLQLARGLGDRLDVAVVVLVALLERLAWVAARLALGLGARERDVLPVGLAAVGPAELGAAQRPAGGGGGRRLDARHAHAGDLVSRLLLLRKQGLVRAPGGDRLRVAADDAVLQRSAEVE